MLACGPRLVLKPSPRLVLAPGFRQEEFTKAQALALQRALLARFEAPAFQRALRELAAENRWEEGKSKGYLAPHREKVSWKKKGGGLGGWVGSF